MANHPGFKAVQTKIESEGYSKEAAGAILAKKSREASPAAKAANPKLKKVKEPKEIGIPKHAPRKVKKMDEKMDKEKGLKEGSPADLKADRKIMRDYKITKAK